jgi:ubiquinone/menaquinone biosynthesis C-methylase UbiE
MAKQKNSIDNVEKSSGELKRYYQSFFDESADYWGEVYNGAVCRKDDFHAKMLNARMGHAIRMCTEGANEKLCVLEIGCGGGILAKRLSDLGHRVYAVDHSYQMVVKARQATRGDSGRSPVHLGAGDIENLAFPPECFDRVTCLGVLMYLKSYDRAINEIKRVLKTEGVAIIAVSNKMRIEKLLDLPILLKKAILKLFRSKKIVPLNHCIPYRFNHRLKENGFEILEYMTHGFGPLTFNGKVVFSHRVNRFVDNLLGKLSVLPVFSALGYTYIVKAKKSGQDRYYRKSE